jgi:ferritin-like protein
MTQEQIKKINSLNEKLKEIDNTFSIVVNSNYTIKETGYYGGNVKTYLITGLDGEIRQLILERVKEERQKVAEQLASLVICTEDTKTSYKPVEL